MLEMVSIFQSIFYKEQIHSGSKLMLNARTKNFSSHRLPLTFLIKVNAIVVCHKFELICIITNIPS